MALEKIGLMFQLGHAGGICPAPRATQHLMVLHTNGVHSVQAMWCGCDVGGNEFHWHQLMHTGWYPATMADPHSCAMFECLDTFRLLNVVANVNVGDYISFLEQKIDALGTEWIPDRYKAFGRMSQQWVYLLRLKRAGIDHLKEGIRSAKEGSVAVPCWACPREGVNLPADWKDAPPGLW